MENNPVDRRIIRTKQSIREALIYLLEEKSFDALTVKDLCMKANINRGTFYLHYWDKFDLLEQTINEFTEGCKKIILQADELDLNHYQYFDEPLPAMITLFKYFKENASLMRALLGLKSDSSYLSQMKQLLWNNLIDQELSVHLKKDNFLVPSEYLIAYIISAHLGVLQQWLDRDCQESPQEIALILSRLSFHGPFYAAGIKNAEPQPLDD